MIDRFVRIEEFGRFGNRYLLDHDSGKLIRIEDATNRMEVVKGIFAILFSTTQKIRTLPEKKSAEWDAISDANYGVLKKYWFGRNVLIYRFAGTLYLRVGRKIEKVISGDVITQTRVGPFFFSTIHCGKIKACALGSQWFDYISRLIDPTYDDLDRLGADFYLYVRNAVRNINNRGRAT